jgi:hypothetical protein
MFLIIGLILIVVFLNEISEELKKINKNLEDKFINQPKTIKIDDKDPISTKAKNTDDMEYAMRGRIYECGSEEAENKVVAILFASVIILSSIGVICYEVFCK